MAGFAIKTCLDCNLQFAHLNFLNLFMSMKKQCDNCSRNYQNLHSLIMSKKDLLYNTVMLYQTCFEEISSHRDQPLKKNNPCKTELLFIDWFPFRSILFDPFARRWFCISRMGRLRSCLLFDLFYSFFFLVPQFVQKTHGYCWIATDKRIAKKITAQLQA